MSNKTKEILTIEGERVEKRYSAKAGDCCHKCCFWSDAYGMCRAERADSTPPCQDYDSKEGGFAYFVPAKESGERDFREKAEIIKAIIEAKGFRYTHDEMMRMTKKELLAYYKEIEGTPQEVTLIPSNGDADKAAYQYAKTNRRICSNEVCERLVFCGNLADAFKAGIAYERERMMEEAVEGQVSAIDTARFIDIDQDICDKRLAECKDGDKVKLIILKEAGK